MIGDISCHGDANGIDFGDDIQNRSPSHVLLAFVDAWPDADRKSCKQRKHCQRANIAVGIRSRTRIVGVGTHRTRIHA